MTTGHARHIGSCLRPEDAPHFVWRLKYGNVYIRIGIYGNVYLGSRVLYAIWHIYIYVHNVHVHIIWYMATILGL